MIGGVTRRMFNTSPIWGPPPPCKQALKQLTFKLISIPFSHSVNSILQCNTTYLLQKEPLVGSQNSES